MSGNKKTTNSDKNNNLGTWILILILMFAVPPLGWILLLIKLGVFAGRKMKSKTNFSNKSETSADNLTNSTSVKTNIKRTRLDKKTGKGVASLLMVASIVFFIIGGIMSLNAISTLFAGFASGFAELGYGAFWLLSGFVANLSRISFKSKISRYKNYYAYIGERGVVPISDFAQMSGKSQKVVKRDLQTMINNGYLDSDVYIDNELDCLVLSAKEAHKLREEIRNGSFIDKEDEKHSNLTVGAYSASLAELREANTFIKDGETKEKVSKLIELTTKIFKIVEENPKKQQQLKRFMNYYLPTTLKLIRSYATLESQGISGENIVSTKNSINDVLNTLTIGFEQQLDQLFSSEAIDIASDISVLENLMQQDGLSGDKSGFQTAVSGS